MISQNMFEIIELHYRCESLHADCKALLNWNAQGKPINEDIFSTTRETRK